jgi:hypothetical protein
MYEVFRIRIGFNLDSDPDTDRDPDPGFLMTKKNYRKKIFFLQNIAIFIPRPPGRPSYRISLEPSYENIQHFKT